MHNTFIAEGSKVVMDLLNSTKIVCEHIVGKAIWLKENEPGIRKYYKGPLEAIEEYELEKISALATPNQVLGVFKKPTQGEIKLPGNFTLALDTIQDPGNLGTIIRIADWFGVKAIICSENCADMYNPKVVQSSMGSIGRVEVAYVDLAEWLRIHDAVPVYAAALNGKNIAEMKNLTEGIIIIGNESKGIRSEIMQMANEQITIPKTGEAESLNAAVATGIILSHLTLTF
ncbi:MAG: RNA methyltransferase [Ferruginibacter sp.]